MQTVSQFWTLIITTSITAIINGVVYVLVTRSVINALDGKKTKDDGNEG